MRSKVLFLFIICLTTINSQIWSGTFQIAPGCNTDSCCCPTNEIVIQKTSSTMAYFSTSITGFCLGETSISSSI